MTPAASSVQAVVGGPRATELFSAVTAAAVAGVAALARATEVVAEFAAALAAALETAHARVSACCSTCRKVYLHMAQHLHMAQRRRRQHPCAMVLRSPTRRRLKSWTRAHHLSAAGPKKWLWTCESHEP